jgi:peptide/nickel transport system substrate-binding protein
MLFIQKIKNILATFKPLSILGIFVLSGVFLFSVFALIIKLHGALLVSVPGYGGEIHEGIVGSPRFINPVLAISQSDLDMTALVYSGLLKTDVDGNIVPDLAQSYGVSEDLLTYTLVLKEDISFHDGTAVTVEDVLYTVALVQDDKLGSPKKIQWEGVGIKKIDENTVAFTLKQPYPEFLKILSLGILPKHIWKDLSVEAISLSDYNLSPVGAGPYKITNIEKKGGIPNTYLLSAFSDYALGRPYIDSVTINVYPNSDELFKDLEKRSITNVCALSPQKASSLQDASDLSIVRTPLPRVYGVFWNQSKNPALVDVNVRKALSLSIDKKHIITESLYGFGIPADSPLPFIFTQNKAIGNGVQLEEAATLLEKSGYTKNTVTGFFEKTPGNSSTELTVTLTSTGNLAEFEKTAQILKESWEKLGVRTTIELYELGDLNQKIIKERGYSALLYGTVIQTNADLYAFWHSSQIKEPGLNLSGYANTKVDAALEKLRSENDPEVLAETYKTISDEFTTDSPAAFIYSPEFIYITDKKINLPVFQTLINPEDRFENINRWYIKKENIYRWLQSFNTLQTLQNNLY